MIGEISSTPFKGTITIANGSNPYAFDTKEIAIIRQREKYKDTEIVTYNPRYEKDNFCTHHVPTSVASTADILAAYTAANSSRYLHVELADKSAK